MNAGSEYQNSVIAKINGRNKVIDFRHNLSLASPDDYAAMHGQGGKHGRRSVISVYLCDYRNKNRDGSVTVKANLTPTEVAVLYEVAKRCITTPASASVGSVTPAAMNALQNALNALRAAAKAGSADKDALCRIGTDVGAAVNMLGSTDSVSKPDFELHRQSINPYKKLDGGRNPVTYIDISHSAFDKQGNVSRYPWYISIRNGTGLNGGSNGTVNVKSGSFQLTGEAFINLSDVDFFGAMLRVNSFVDKWEQGIALPQLMQREQARMQQWG